ncbi:MAG: PAS domain S-box protein [Alphaproteobacteria bacterium]|nr:PAS domain S-box protein [Alphaproteobacteria bacterium]
MAQDIRNHGEDDPRAVLVASDDVADANLIRRCFGAKGIVVKVETDAAEILPALDRDHFDVLLLDASDAHADDYAQLRGIRAEHSEAKLPILAIIDPILRDAAAEALAAGADDVLGKPLQVAVVEARVGLQLSLIDAREKLERSTQALEQQTNHLRVVMDSATISIFALDRNTTFTSANQMTAEITGTPVADLIGAAFAEVIHPDQRDDVETLLKRVAEEGFFVTNHETEFHRADGSRRTVILSLRALTVDGNISGVAGIANDVTDIFRQRKQLTAYIDSLMSPDAALLGVLGGEQEEQAESKTPKLDVAVAKGEPPKPSELGKDEVRIEKRKKVYKGARLSFNDEQSVMNCIVRDVSDNGARLEFKSHFDCPQYATLRLDDGRSFDCEVMRFANLIMGVKLIGRHW